MSRGHTQTHNNSIAVILFIAVVVVDNDDKPGRRCVCVSNLEVCILSKI